MVVELVLTAVVLVVVLVLLLVVLVAVVALLLLELFVAQLLVLSLVLFLFLFQSLLCRFFILERCKLCGHRQREVHVFIAYPGRSYGHAMLNVPNTERETCKNEYTPGRFLGEEYKEQRRKKIENEYK